MTDNEFDGILESIVDGLTAAQILAIPGIYEVLREELNNDILDTWAEQNPEKAFTDEEDEDEDEEEDEDEDEDE